MKKILKNKKIKTTIMIIIFLCVVGYTAYNIAYTIILNYNLNRVQVLVKKIDKINDVEYVDGKVYNNYNGKYKNEKLLFTNLEKAQNYNKDIHGYMKVEGTNISTVYTYTKEKEYYLNRTIDDNKNIFGWIYLDNRNNINMENNNTIFYAHGIPDKTLFADLKKMVDTNWFENNEHLIYTSTEENSYLWEIFSIYYTDSSAEYLNTTYKQQYINKIIKLSTNNFDVEVNEEDKIITLVTCYDLQGYHLVVHGKLIKTN